MSPTFKTIGLRSVPKPQVPTVMTSPSFTPTSFVAAAPSPRAFLAPLAVVAPVPPRVTGIATGKVSPLAIPDNQE
ncbi:hypothetical protein KLC93_003241 [Acinetobacter baumannii]